MSKYDLLWRKSVMINSALFRADRAFFTAGAPIGVCQADFF